MESLSLSLTKYQNGSYPYRSFREQITKGQWDLESVIFFLNRNKEINAAFIDPIESSFTPLGITRILIIRASASKSQEFTPNLPESLIEYAVCQSK